MKHCKGITYEGNWPRDCFRPVKAEGYCARHLAGRRRRAENDAKQQAAFDAKLAIRNQQTQDVLMFATNFGVMVKPVPGVAGEFIITREELRRILTVTKGDATI
jgi:hypothetical protein